MPSWGHFSDRQLADIFAHLRKTFVPAEETPEEDAPSEEEPRDDPERPEGFE
jgi:hypothetical protein